MRTCIKVIIATALLVSFTTAVAMGDGPEVRYAPKVERGVPLNIKVKVPGKGCVIVFVDGLLQDIRESKGREVELKLMTNRLESGFHNVTLKFSEECAVDGKVIYSGKFYVEEREKQPLLEFDPGEITSVMLLLVTALLVVLIPGRLPESSLIA